MKKRLLAILLAVCMVISMAPAAFAADSVFTDVNSGAWYADEVLYVYENGLMYGVGNNEFNPSGTVTRAMVWTTMARLAGETLAETSPWWEAGRQWAMDNGISDGTMATDNVTREQLVTMFWRYCVYKGYDVSEGENFDIQSYADASKVSEWAVVAMQWACAVGIINGTNNGLEPRGDATRAQLAAILYRYVEEVIPVEEEPSEPSEPSTPGTPGIPSTPSTPSTPTDPPHEHDHEYTPNNDGTHDGACECGEDAITNETCTYVEGICSKCGYAEPVTPPEHEHDYTYTPNYNGTHNGVCANADGLCDAVNVTNEPCGDWAEGGFCAKCGFNKEAVAVIGGTYYPTLAAAITAVQEDETIRILKDTAETGLVVSKVICFFIDGAGHSYNHSEITAGTCYNLVASGSPSNEYLGAYNFTQAHTEKDNYTTNNNGTHIAACDCGGETVNDEACTYVEGICSKCGYAESATVTAITVNSSAHKTEYKVGDSLDVTNLTILVDMSYGSDPTVEVTAGMVTGFDSSAVVAEQTLTITYEGKTTAYTISIGKADGPAAPTGLAGVDPTFNGDTDGKITGTTAAMEYSTTTDFASAIDCNETETTGLAAGTYYVRVKATATHNAGAYATVVVPEQNLYFKLVGGSTPETATKLADVIGNYADGTTIVLTSSYYDLSLPAGTEVPKNLTIIGGGKNATPVVKCDIKANIDGLTLKNIWFMAGGGITGNASAEASQSIKNMTVDTCYFEGGDTALQLGSAVCENMTIKGCEFTGNVQSNAIRLYNVSGETKITGNKIYSAGKYGISLLGTVSGTVTIDDNTIEENNQAAHDDDGNGGLRIQNVLENSTVAITNNDLTNACTEAGQVLKVSSTGTGASVTFAGNTYGGEAWNPDTIGAGETNAMRMVPVELVGGSTPETATKLVDHLAKYVDGTTIVLTSSYYDLSLPAGTEVPKNLTIIGGGKNATPVVRCEIKADIDGLTLQNIWFMAGGGISGNTGGDNTQTIQNMTVDTCYFEGGDTALILGSNVCENMTIKNCEFTGNVLSNAIRLFNVSGETKITGNKIYSAGNYGIALLGTVSGTVTVDNNIIEENDKAGGDNAGLRIQDVQANTTVTISNNDLTNACKADGQVIKVSSTGTNSSVTFTSNTYDGEAWEPEDIGAGETNAMRMVPVELGN